MIMCGMSAAFSALFGTPMAAAIFPMEIVSVGIMHYAALVPCVISSFIAHGIAEYFGATAHTFFFDRIPAFQYQTTERPDTAVHAIRNSGRHGRHRLRVPRL